MLCVLALVIHVMFLNLIPNIMKKIFLSMLAGLTISLSVFAQNYTLMVSGTVQIVVNNAIIPVPGQAVNITIDSTNTGFFYQNTVFTDQLGYYADIIDMPPDFGYGYVWVSTLDSCLGQYQSQGQFFAPGTTIPAIDFYLCNVLPNPCMATFYAYQADPADPFTFQFANQSTGNFTQVYWSFGDSTFSNEFGPIHTFPGPGSYYVCLTISDGMECNSTYCDFVYTGGGNNGCENYFIYQYSNNDPYTLTFQGFLTNGLSSDFYWWDFGDGSTGEGQTVTHTFPSGQGMNGVFMVGLTTMVTDSMNDSCVYTSYQEVRVENGQGCSAYFTYEQTDSTIFTFSGYIYLNNGMIYPDSNSVFLWDFGDGTTGTGQTITHYFQQNPAGGYTVCLTASVVLPDGNTCTSDYCEAVNTGMPGFNIYGYVVLGNNLYADFAVVHLLTLDTLGQNVTEVGSTMLDSMGFYSFSNIPMYNTRLYYVQAELNQESQYFGQYLPTYYESALTWEEATPILPLMNWPANIYMIPAGQLQSGDGVISGTVEELGTRGFMNDVEIVLMDPDKNPLAYSKSNEEGLFVFDGLAFGTYVIHVEIMGIHTVQAQVSLSTDQPEASVEVQVTGDQANIVFGVPEQKVVIENVGEIYPNPVANNAKLTLQ
jgi:PKD repeat protein